MKTRDDISQMLEAMGADRCNHSYTLGYMHFQLLKDSLVCKFIPPKGTVLEWGAKYESNNFEEGIQSCVFIAQLLKEQLNENYKLPYCLRKEVSDKRMELMHAVFSKECDKKLLGEEKQKFYFFIDEWNYHKKKGII